MDAANVSHPRERAEDKNFMNIKIAVIALSFHKSLTQMAHSSAKNNHKLEITAEIKDVLLELNFPQKNALVTPYPNIYKFCVFSYFHLTHAGYRIVKLFRQYHVTLLTPKLHQTYFLPAAAAAFHTGKTYTFSSSFVNPEEPETCRKGSSCRKNFFLFLNHIFRFCWELQKLKVDKKILKY